MRTHSKSLLATAVLVPDKEYPLSILDADRLLPDIMLGSTCPATSKDASLDRYFVFALSFPQFLMV